MLRAWLLAVVVIGCVADVERPPNPGAFEDVRRVVALLDDVAGEYPRAVADGAVIDAVRMRVIATMVHDAQLFGARFPADEIESLRALERAIVAREEPTRVVGLARDIRRELVIGHQLVLAPAAPPDRDRAIQLWEMLCSGCHGVTGFGDGPQGLALDPGPKNFHEPAFMAELAPSRAFSQISDGVRGTAMPQWGLFTTSERWGLAFLVFAFRHDEAAIARGRLRLGSLDVPTSLTALADRTDGELVADLIARGVAPTDADDALAFLRAEVAFAAPSDRLAGVRTELAELARNLSDRGASSRVARLRGQLAPPIEATRAASPVTAARIEQRLDRLEVAVATRALGELVEREIVAIGTLLDDAEPALRAPDVAGTIRLMLELALVSAIGLGLLWSRGPRTANAAVTCAMGLIGAIGVGFVIAPSTSTGMIWIVLAGALIAVSLARGSRSAIATAAVSAALVGLPIGRLSRAMVDVFGNACASATMSGAAILALAIVVTRAIGGYAFARWPRGADAITVTAVAAVAAGAAGRGAWSLSTTATIGVARVEALGLYPSAFALTTAAIAFASVIGASALRRNTSSRSA